MPDYHLHFRLLEERHHCLFTGDLELHILELPKFTKSAAELQTDLDIWLYFLRHAETMDPDALPAPVEQHPLARQAVEELKMLTQTDLERERYEARRKAQMDHNSWLNAARLEGLEAGRAEGELFGQIHLCERLLKRAETPTEQLASLKPEELKRLADQLQAEMLQQRG